MNQQISLFKVHMPQSVAKPLLETLFSGFIGQGAKVEEFEESLRNYIGNPYPLTLNSGTAGLHLALRLANVGSGDEVITTPMTCTASNMPILAAGAKIVWADINPSTGNIDPADIARKITKKTKAIMVVHWGGYPCDMDEINAIARAHNIKVIEDGAHAIGAEYHGQKIGNHSDFVMFSLQAIKHITTVDGGVLCCKHESDHARGKLLRWYGIDRDSKRKDFRCEEDILEWGYKYHMNDICAVIGIEQMNYLDGILAKQRENAAFYDQALNNLPGIRTIKWADDRRSAFWLYTMHVDNRDEFREYMKEKGVMTSQVHARNDSHTTFKPYASNTIPNVAKFVDTMICIPVGWWVAETEREYIADCIKKFGSH